MSALAILEYPDRRLRIRAAPVTAFDGRLWRLIDDLFDTLYATRGIGLAATQVNVHQRVLVIDVSERRNEPRCFINPEILAHGVVGMVEESCLSLPGVVGNVKRATQLRVRSRDRSGASCDLDLEGLPAVCLQHEMDHLDGRLFVDHLSLYRRLRLRWQPPLRGAAARAAS